MQNPNISSFKFDFVNYHEQMLIHKIKCKSEHRAQSTQKKKEVAASYTIIINELTMSKAESSPFKKIL